MKFQDNEKFIEEITLNKENLLKLPKNNFIKHSEESTFLSTIYENLDILPIQEIKDMEQILEYQRRKIQKSRSENLFTIISNETYHQIICKELYYYDQRKTILGMNYMLLNHILYDCIILNDFEIEMINKINLQKFEFMILHEEHKNQEKELMNRDVGIFQRQYMTGHYLPINLYIIPPNNMKYELEINSDYGGIIEPRNYRIDYKRERTWFGNRLVFENPSPFYLLYKSIG